MTKTPTHERALRQPRGLRRRRRHRRQASARGGRRGHVLDRARRRRAARISSCKDLADAGVNCMPIIDRTRPTTHKNAFVCGDYRLLKVDTLDNRSISDRMPRSLAEQICEHAGRRRGVQRFPPRHLQSRTIPGLTAAIPDGAFRVADSQVASRWGNILEFKGFDLITPNEREARFALGDQDSGVRPLGRQAVRGGRCKTLILKLGERGVMTFRAGQGGRRRPRLLRRRQLRRARGRRGRRRRRAAGLCHAFDAR